ncbi:MAG: carbamoyl-phosphate synthase (glutamine-hydrolyzing) large subunit [Bacteroidales bacterium]
MEDIHKVLILGSGALKIGEAGEFDYSGAQALKALKEENIETVLINPNIATVQTSKGIANKIYFLPITPFFVEKVIQEEKPDGILLAFGGQTALNCGVELFKAGILKKYHIEVLGTPIATIINTEDREEFAKKLAEINVKSAHSIAVTSIKQAVQAAKEIGYPLIVRAAFTLGGQGSGFCHNENELIERATNALSYSPQILLEESLKGWKEIEYEVVRDQYNNCITVCNMENFDPLGIHTGESIVIAPSQTLSNAEYHKLRELAIRIIRHLGVVGECNVQYALDPDSEDYRVIEVNARLSRSSALASKATAYPLAFIAAKLALGYGLHELKNQITTSTTACFEPALDYVVIKIPRWDLNKFPGVSHVLGSGMKSVGEVMSIGRSFEEAMQKGLRMIGQGMHGFVGNHLPEYKDIRSLLKNPTDMRIFHICKAFEQGFDIDEIFHITKINRWFLCGLKNIFDLSEEIKSYNLLDAIPKNLLIQAKQYGFSDFQLAKLILKPSPDEMDEHVIKVRNWRKSKNVFPVVKQIDTLAGEYPAKTNYLYLTYNGDEQDINYSEIDKGYIVLGSGAYRIGSSVEFDWCSVNAVETIKKNGSPAIMINYNPETVSTDYDICDRLYFDELSLERVLDIYDLEKPEGLVISTGGQIPNNLALKLYKQDINILGTSPISIDKAENRKTFSALLDSLNIDQPRWKELTTIEAIHSFVDNVGYPVLIRPSYVLSGAAMNVVSNKHELKTFLLLAKEVSKQHPVVVSEFIEGAKEIEFDAVAKDGLIICEAISEHVEFAGVHSGDATLVFPPQKIYFETIRRIRRTGAEIAKALNISGPFNMQVLARNNDLKVIECNLRASRSFPFVSKVLDYNFIEAATLVMLERPVTKKAISMFDLDHIGVKASQFSFSRLTKADPILGVDMSSTGEVGCIGDSFDDALLKAMLSVGYHVKTKTVLISSGPLKSKIELLETCKLLIQDNYTIYGTKGSVDFLSKHNIPAKKLTWPDEEKSPNTISYLKSHKIGLVINIPKDLSKDELYNDYQIRRSAIDYNIPLFTNTRLAIAFVTALVKKPIKDLEIKSANLYWDKKNNNTSNID